jgi:hypothetical protein
MLRPCLLSSFCQPRAYIYACSNIHPPAAAACVSTRARGDTDGGTSGQECVPREPEDEKMLIVKLYLGSNFVSQRDQCSYQATAITPGDHTQGVESLAILLEAQRSSIICNYFPRPCPSSQGSCAISLGGSRSTIVPQPQLLSIFKAFTPRSIRKKPSSPKMVPP